MPQTDEERAILELNRECRREELKHEDGLAFRLRIPTRHLEAIKHMVPEMQNQQPRETQHRAWKWFMRDNISKPYKVK